MALELIGKREDAIAAVLTSSEKQLTEINQKLGKLVKDGTIGAGLQDISRKLEAIRAVIEKCCAECREKGGNPCDDGIAETIGKMLDSTAELGQRAAEAGVTTLAGIAGPGDDAESWARELHGKMKRGDKIRDLPGKGDFKRIVLCARQMLRKQAAAA